MNITLKLANASIPVTVTDSDTPQSLQQQLATKHGIKVVDTEASAFLQYVRSYKTDSLDNVDFHKQFPTALLPPDLALESPKWKGALQTNREPPKMQLLSRAKPSMEDSSSAELENAVLTLNNNSPSPAQKPLSLMLPTMTDPSTKTKVLSFARGASVYQQILQDVQAYNKKAETTAPGDIAGRNALYLARSALADKCAAWFKKHGDETDKSHRGSMDTLQTTLRDLQKAERDVLADADLRVSFENVKAALPQKAQALVKEALENLPANPAKLPEFIATCLSRADSLSGTEKAQSAPLMALLARLEANDRLGTHLSQTAFVLLGGQGQPDAAALKKALLDPPFSASVSSLIGPDDKKAAARSPFNSEDLGAISLTLDTLAQRSPVAFGGLARLCNDALSCKPAERAQKMLTFFSAFSTHDDKHAPPELALGWRAIKGAISQRLAINIVKAEVEAHLGKDVDRMTYFSGAVGGYLVEYGKPSKQVFAKMVINDDAAVRGGNSEGAQAELLAEASSMKQLGHKPDARARLLAGLVHQQKTEVGALVLSEFFPSKELGEILSKGALPEKKALATVAQVALGLAYCHQKGLLHRDVKPANVLVNDAGKVKIIDFNTMVPVTSDAQQAGTPSYAPNEPYTVKSEVFSVGVMLALSLGAKKADNGFPLDAVGTKALFDSLPSSVSESTKKLIGMMLAPDPKDRPEMSAVAEQLEHLAR